jgi:16S rRNA processing protein RimM
VAPDAWVPLAEVARPHGVRGELRLRLYNQDSDLLLELDEVMVRFGSAGAAGGNGAKGAGPSRDVVLRVEAVRPANEAILMKLQSVNDRDRAIELRGAEVCARRSAFPPLEPGEFYACDVEGARVVVGGGAEVEELGTVLEMRSYPTVDVLVVAAADGGRPWEVPLVDAVVERVDVQQGLVTLSTREGVERA